MSSQLQNNESMLKESIKHFLTSYHSGSSDFSTFESIFFRLIQTMLDPPLEITWFYSAVTFHSSKLSSENKISTRVLIAKDMLTLLISCSNLSSASKKIALLAPVVYELYSIVCDSRRKSEMCEKMEVGNLVENLVSYVVMSAGVYDYGNEDVGFDNAVFCFEDLIRVWTTDRGGGSCNFVESLRMFFPLSTAGIRKGMSEKCGIRELVGVILCEVFFLRLFLNFTLGMRTMDFLKDTRENAVQIIKGFRNCYFLDMLLNMLLEPRLPVADSLSSEDAALLDKALYDAVILVEYSFYSGRWVESSVTRSKKLALVWVLAADHAIQLSRVRGDLARAFAYLNAFRESQLVSELTKWVLSQPRTVDRSAWPDVTTPRALIQWLLVLQDQGIQVFDHSMSRLREKAVACMSRLESELPELMSRIENLNQNIFVPGITFDQNDDIEMNDQSNNSSPGAPCSMSPTGEAGNKRKEGPSGENKSRVKQVRLHTSGNVESSGSGSHGRPNTSANREIPFSSGSGSHEVIAIPSDDDDMEVIG